ncbi:MAG: hypothetical protein ABSD58_02095 [Verrucomicrobiia bacterium]|jgi:hypothetical protein
MKRVITIVLMMLAGACSYSHVGPAFGTFSRPTPPVGAGSLEGQVGPLVLQLGRHVDTVMNGPDNEEDQTLILHVQGYHLNQRLAIPSDSVTPDFTATRFGPTSKGGTFSGYLIIRKITADKVEAYLHLDVTASTASGKYTQTAKYDGNYTFRHSDEEAAQPSPN